MTTTVIHLRKVNIPQLRNRLMTVENSRGGGQVSVGCDKLRQNPPTVTAEPLIYRLSKPDGLEIAGTTKKKAEYHPGRCPS